MAAETTLYAAVKAFLEAQGFSAKGEIGNCDIVAVPRGRAAAAGDLRAEAGPSTWSFCCRRPTAWPPPTQSGLPCRTRGAGGDRDRRVVKLCRLLGFGLLSVASDGIVSVLAEPSPYQPRRNAKRRTRLLREHARRNGDPTPGGSVRRTIMTAYRQRAVLCAEALRAGPATTRALAQTMPEAPGILLRNMYGWFERVERGTYRLSAAGRVALEGG